MKTSSLYSLNARDFLLGLGLAVGAAVASYVVSAIDAGVLLNLAFLKAAGMTALYAGLAYLVKNFFSNNTGEFAVADSKK